MDKSMVLSAYRRGFITLQECAQLLGIESMRIMGLLNEPAAADRYQAPYYKQPANR